ncbi:hypothetical protein RhiirA4_41699 [Rhizophagus irregularis]|uniref:Secreted protein n=1 Tax=Rhizophagus irregularis TaxID=588596 RepID=A0A2I1G3V5_9GLOM|nr:hypothetical protein RhiirA4_41699 [Rhizophagus irregularis]
MFRQTFLCMFFFLLLRTISILKVCACSHLLEFTNKRSFAFKKHQNRSSQVSHVTENLLVVLLVTNKK